MIKGTFCDWLMMQGVEFHPKTVIVNADCVFIDEKHLPLGKNAVIRPSFNFTFWEGRYAPDGAVYDELKLGFYVCNKPKYKTYLKLNNDCNVYDIIVFTANTKSGIIGTGNRVILVIDENGIEIHKNLLPSESFLAKMGYDDINELEHVFHNVDPRILQGMPSDAIGSEVRQDLFEAMWAFNQNTEIELVDYSDIHKRIITKRDGKKPSPYFLIINPEATQKRYEGNRPSHKSGIKMPFHRRRGHFRHVENHPIAHFNKTSFIQATTVGNKAKGTILKGYTIRLPEKNK